MGAWRIIAAALALGSGTGCWLDRIPIEDLGSTGDGGGTPAADPEPDPAPDPVKDYLEQIDPGFVGRWEGYVEDPFQPGEDGRPTPAVFPSGSTRVTLEYTLEGTDFEGEGPSPEARLVFGASPAPVPELGVAYPPGAHHYFGYLGGRPFDSPVVEGFEYILKETEQRFAGYDPGHDTLLSFRQFVPFLEWCRVQEARDQGDGDYECVGASSFGGGDPIQGEPCSVSRADGSVQDVDCDFVAMCLSDLCICQEYGCDLNLERYLDPMGQVFLERQGDQIVGTISGAKLDTGLPGWYSPMGTLRLSRVDE